MSDPLDPRPRDTSLYQVLRGLERGSQAVIDGLGVLGTALDHNTDRLEAVERGWAECRQECQRCREERERRDRDRGVVWSSLSSVFSYPPVRWLLTALVLVAVAVLARECNVEVPNVPIP